MMISEASYSLKACIMPFEMFVASRLCVIIITSAALAIFMACSSVRLPVSWFL